MAQLFLTKITVAKQRNYKLLLTSVTMDTMRLDNVLRETRGTFWNDLKGTAEILLMQKWRHCSECKLLMIRVQRHYLCTLEKAACGRSCSVTLYQGSSAESLILHMTRGMPELALLGQRNVVHWLTQAGAKPDFLLWTWDIWLQEGSKSSLTTGDGKQGWPLDPFAVLSERGINSCAWPSLSTYNRPPQEAKEGWATFRASDHLRLFHLVALVPRGAQGLEIEPLLKCLNCQKPEPRASSGGHQCLVHYST